MSSWTERVPVVGVLLSLLALAAVTTATVGPDHLLLALALACALTLAVTTDTALAPRLLSVRRRSDTCGRTGVRSADPDGSGRPRPRAPGSDS